MKWAYKEHLERKVLSLKKKIEGAMGDSDVRWHYKTLG
jgi:hypothetical protein